MPGTKTLLISGLVCLLSSSAVAEDGASPADQKKAQEAFAEGRQLYDGGDKPAAVEKFKEAFRLSRNPLLLYNVGLVYDEIGDKAMAIHYYSRFCEKAKGNPKAKDNRMQALERLEELRREPVVEEPKAKAAAAPAEGAAPPMAKRPRSPGAFAHNAVETARAGRVLPIRAEVPAGLSAMVYYRAAGAEQFASVKMREGEAKIPAKAIHGHAVHYYVEARDAKGDVVARAGDAGSPNIVEVMGGGPVPEIEDVEDENPLTRAQNDGGESGKRGTNWLKWGTTTVAVGLVAGAVVSYITANNYQTALDDELTYRCGNTDCPAETDYEKDLMGSRDNYRMASYVTATAGVVTIGFAGYLWYKDATRDEQPRGAAKAKRAISSAPVIGPGYVGAAAVLEF